MTNAKCPNFERSSTKKKEMHVTITINLSFQIQLQCNDVNVMKNYQNKIFSWIQCKRIVVMSDSTINGIQNNYGVKTLLK